MSKYKLLLTISIILILLSAVFPILLGENGNRMRVSSAIFAASLLPVMGFALYRRAPLPVFRARDGRGGEKREGRITFERVAANENAKRSVMELVEFLKTPEKFASVGARIPHGVLLYGPPGTGKTLLARALAGEAGVPFLALNGSDFVEMYAGVGAKRVRETFKRARKLGKCVIFIDEIDSVGRTRGVNSSDERDQTLNALLGEMSGFSPSEGIIVVAATNRADTLDAALLRPGRFDRRIEVGMPDAKERLEILALHSGGKPLAENVSLRELARQTVFFSGASLENLLNEAAIRAARRGAGQIENEDIQTAFVSAVAGDDRKSALSARERGAIALHEAAHAVVSGVLLPENTIRRVSILPSGNGAAGYNLTIPDEKRMLSKTDLGNQISVLLAGRAAEEMILGDENVTVGASNDLKRAAELAGGMAVDLGFGGEMYASLSALSRVTGAGNDGMRVAKEILSDRYEDAKRVLSQNMDALMDVTDALIQNEALDEGALKAIFSRRALSNESENSTKEPAFQ